MAAKNGTSSAGDELTFHAARAQITAARSARTELSRCWSELCDQSPFEGRVVATGDDSGRLDVAVTWPTGLARRADAAAVKFASAICSSLDIGLAAVATAVSGAIERPMLDDYRFPICQDEAEFTELLEQRHLRGLRPDHIQVVRSVQPYVLCAPEAPSSANNLGVALQQLANMRRPSTVSRRPVAVWAHSATPLFDASPPSAEVTHTVTGDGLLESTLTVATFTSVGIAAGDVGANPMTAFDLVLSVPPLPRHPDDNHPRRSAHLLAFADQFVEALERSVSIPSGSGQLAFGSLAPILDGAPWSEVARESSETSAEIDQALSESDLGIATQYHADGGITVLLRVGETTYRRPIPPAIPLDPDDDKGTAAEAATRHAASLWGLPDFVYRPLIVKKGASRREVGDCTVVAGPRALAVQVKHRTPEAQTPLDVEVGRVISRIRKAASQASGSIRSLRATPTDLINDRGRTTRIDGGAVEWCRVVIIDHPDPPDVVVDRNKHDADPIVILTRRDWDFLFDQLRSTTAVVDYLFRVSVEETHTLGEEPARYFELARADRETSESEGPAEWTQAVETETISAPILPTAPASSSDEGGATVYRLILEDVATTQIEATESDRMMLLSLLDRYPISERAGLGRLLLTHLDDGHGVEGAMWQFRRTTLDEGTLQLAFGVCNSFSNLHQQVFSRWAMLRHHDFCGLYPRAAGGAAPRTVAVLLTPRLNGSARLWDTTTVTIVGELGLTVDELRSLRDMWDSNHARRE